MNTTTLPFFATEPSLLAKLSSGIRSLFVRLDAGSSALAASLAGELRARPELPEWVLSLTGVSRRNRTASLLRTANSLRRDGETFEAADALKRMASRPALFNAVARHLNRHAALCNA
jgi:hypothetical protein